MRQANAWTEITSNPDVLAEDIARRIRAAVQWRRWLGSKLEHAMDQAALPLRITARRVRSFCRSEVNGIAWAEYRALRDAITRDRDEHIAALIARTEALEREADADVIGQLQLPFGDTACGFGSAGGGGRRLQSEAARPRPGSGGVVTSPR